MTQNKGMRLDKFLWAVRLFKTRSRATEACRNGKIQVNNQVSKPSREVVPGDHIQLRRTAILQVYRVLDLPTSRVGAKLVPDLIEDLTPVEEYEKLQMMKEVNYERREKGLGRPSKKDRREIDQLKKRS